MGEQHIILDISTPLNTSTSFIAATSGDSIHVYSLDLATKEIKQQLGFELDNVRDASFSRSGRYLVVGAGDKGEVYLFEKGRLLWKRSLGSYSYDLISSVSISDEGDFIVAGTHNFIHLLNKMATYGWKKHSGRSSKVSVSNDGSYIAAATSDKIYMYNKDGKLLWEYKTGTYISDVVISPDNTFLVASGHNSVYFFDIHGNLLIVQNVDGTNVNKISISSNSLFVSIGANNGLYLFSRTGDLLWDYKTNEGINAVSISSDCSYLIAGTSKGRILILRLPPKVLKEAGKLTIERVESLISRIKLNINLNEIKNIISQAKKANNDGDYISANSLAIKAEEELKAAIINNLSYRDLMFDTRHELIYYDGDYYIVKHSNLIPLASGIEIFSSDGEKINGISEVSNSLYHLSFKESSKLITDYDVQKLNEILDISIVINKFITPLSEITGFLTQKIIWAKSTCVSGYCLWNVITLAYPQLASVANELERLDDEFQGWRSSSYELRNNIPIVLNEIEKAKKS